MISKNRYGSSDPALQLTKLNALMPDDREAAASWLSPRQLAQIGRLQ